MNIFAGSHTQMDPLLTKLLIQAIRDFSGWTCVLQHIQSVTGARAAMITLRDGRTCQLVDDVALQSRFHSPLICGFSMESLAYYLKELRVIDPWARAQRQHYPFEPSLMSPFCDPKDHPKDIFFQWLTDLGINETVVFELDRMQGYWTAINLFFDEQSSDEAQIARSYLKENDFTLKETWKSSQQFMHMEQAQKVSLEQIGVAACLVNRNFEVVFQNQKFESLKDEGAVACYGPNQRLSVDSSVTFSGDDGLSFEIRRHYNCEKNYRAFLTNFDPDPLHKGQIEGHYLIVFRSPNGDSGRRVFSEVELAQLTIQERKMLNAVQKGQSVSSAGESIGIKRSRAFDVWSSVKVKLSLNSSHQLRRN